MWQEESTLLNLADIGKPLAGHCLRALLCGLGMVNGSVANKVGVDELARLRAGKLMAGRVNRLAKQNCNQQFSWALSQWQLQERK